MPILSMMKVVFPFVLLPRIFFIPESRTLRLTSSLPWGFLPEALGGTVLSLYLVLPMQVQRLLHERSVEFV